MLTLVELLAELKAIATSDAANQLERINALFVDPKLPAEYQVGRHYVAHLLSDEITSQLADASWRKRRAAVESARLAFPRMLAARALRTVVRDPDSRVRTATERAMRALGVHQTPSPVLGRLWPYGIFSQPERVRVPAAPSRASQYGLPAIPNVAALCALLGVDALAPLMRPGTQTGSAYIEFAIPKAKGGTRTIAAPRAPLRKAQRKILDAILAKVPMHDACHGFVARRSTVSNAKPHVGAALVLKLDLKDFFPTVHYRRVRGLFRTLGYNDEVASALAGLTTYRAKNPDVSWPGVLPQGAPTSPALANLACVRLDRRLAALAAKYGATYTRYADDLTFSFVRRPDIRVGRFLWWVDAICQQEGFHERPDKRRVLRSKHQQRITGIVVNAGIHVPRADKRRFRAILHNCAKQGVASQARGNDDFDAYLRGYAAYVHMVEPALGAKLVAEVEKVLHG